MTSTQHRADASVRVMPLAASHAFHAPTGIGDGVARSSGGLA
jgi:hypothetical protein